MAFLKLVETLAQAISFYFVIRTINLLSDRIDLQVDAREAMGQRVDRSLGAMMERIEGLERQVRVMGESVAELEGKMKEMERK